VDEHLQRFIEANSSGRVALLCRALGIGGPKRMAIYIRAVQQAVKAMPALPRPGVAEVDAYLTAQLELLGKSLKRPPPPKLPSRPVTKPADPPQAARATRRPSFSAIPDAKGMPGKLEQSRKPLRRILQEDCVRLTLLTPDRAERLCRQMAGKTREEVETELVAELRNNLHQQVRTYMRKHRGGPWDRPQSQEDVRLDIECTNSVHAVVSLTRHLLRERQQWESQFKRGVLGSLFGGRLKLTGRK
jgi:hypothetical protein